MGPRDSKYRDEDYPPGTSNNMMNQSTVVNIESGSSHNSTASRASPLLVSMFLQEKQKIANRSSRVEQLWNQKEKNILLPSLPFLFKFIDFDFLKSDRSPFMKIGG